MRQITLRIGGMSCDHCERAVRGALAKIPGVELDAVTIGSATLRFDPAKTSVDRLVAAIDDLGYEVLEPVPW
jgi:copper chaperone CopZ